MKTLKTAYLFVIMTVFSLITLTFAPISDSTLLAERGRGDVHREGGNRDFNRQGGHNRQDFNRYGGYNNNRYGEVNRGQSNVFIQGNGNYQGPQGPTQQQQTDMLYWYDVQH